MLKSTIKNNENMAAYSNHQIMKSNKYMEFNQFFVFYTHNKNEIKRFPKIRVEAKETSYETEI